MQQKLRGERGHPFLNNSHGEKETLPRTWKDESRLDILKNGRKIDQEEIEHEQKLGDEKEQVMFKGI